MIDFSFITGLASKVGAFTVNMISGNFLGSAAPASGIFLFIMLGIFIFLAKKIVGLMTSVIVVAAVSALFPVAAGYLGFSIPMTAQTIIFFVIMGLGIYFVFLIAKYLLRSFGIFQRSRT